MSDMLLFIKTSTWLKETHELFDYESTEKILKQINVNISGIISRSANLVYFHAENDSSIEGDLLKVYSLDTEYILAPSKQTPIGISLRYLKENKHKGFKLHEGTVFKLGKSKFKVSKISVQSGNLAEDTLEDGVESDQTCRICLRSSETPENPLISICLCIGTAKLIHLRCLQRWIIAKSFKKVNTHCITYSWTAFLCDICKAQLPLEFFHNSACFTLISIPSPGISHLILEDHNSDHYILQMHVIFAADSPVLLGRNNDCDLKFGDITISRNHATIEFGGGFYLKDRNSKFGTIVMLDKPINIERNQVVTLQGGRTLMEIQVAVRNSGADCVKKYCCKQKRTTVAPGRKGLSYSFSEPEEHTLLVR